METGVVVACSKLWRMGSCSIVPVDAIDLGRDFDTSVIENGGSGC